MVGSGDRKSTRLNSSHLVISYAVFCLKKKKTPSPTYSSVSAMYARAGTFPAFSTRHYSHAPSSRPPAPSPVSACRSPPDSAVHMSGIVCSAVCTRSSTEAVLHPFVLVRIGMLSAIMPSLIFWLDAFLGLRVGMGFISVLRLSCLFFFFFIDPPPPEFSPFSPPAPFPI